MLDAQRRDIVAIAFDAACLSANAQACDVDNARGIAAPREGGHGVNETLLLTRLRVARVVVFQLVARPGTGHHVGDAVPAVQPTGGDGAQQRACHQQRRVSHTLSRCAAASSAL